MRNEFGGDGGTLVAMRRWLLATLSVIVALYVVGWVLVLASGHGGNRVGGSVAVWRLGGIMIYSAVLAAPIWLLVVVTTLAVRQLTRRSA